MIDVRSRIRDLGAAFAFAVLEEMALGAGVALRWTLRKLEDTVAEGNGPLEQKALDDLDAAIESLRAWRDNQDETDAGQIAVRTSAIRDIMGPRPGEAVDALTGVVQPQTAATHGPTSPEEAAQL